MEGPRRIPSPPRPPSSMRSRIKRTVSIKRNPPNKGGTRAARSNSVCDIALGIQPVQPALAIAQQAQRMFAVVPLLACKVPLQHIAQLDDGTPRSVMSFACSCSVICELRYNLTHNQHKMVYHLTRFCLFTRTVLFMFLRRWHGRIILPACLIAASRHRGPWRTTELATSSATTAGER